MKLLLTNNPTNNFKQRIDLSSEIYLSYEADNPISDYIFETKSCHILVNSTHSFINSFESIEPTKETIEGAMDKLVNGFVVYIDKKTAEVTIYTDVFNFKHLFYVQTDDNFYISTDFELLTQLTASYSLDELALIDMYLFNYCLLNRTIQKDIKRCYGGSRISVFDNKIKEEIIYNYAQNYKPSSKKSSSKIKLDAYIKRFSAICKNEVNDEAPTCLSITGGIDSRMILAASNFNDLTFSSFTFGQSGNVESETAEPFIHSYSKHHNFIELDKEYVNQIETHIEAIIKDALDNPTLLDLAHYNLVKQNYNQHNLFFGFLGGELLLGQSDGAQVTFTHFARLLLSCTSKIELRKLLIEQLTKENIFSTDFIERNIDDYVKSIEMYLNKGDNLNILRFLLNEKHAKFFGTINKIVGKNNNIVVPFVHPEIIELYLSTSLSFLTKTPFIKRPYLNMKGKFFQGKVIKKLDPSLGKTRFDRRYSVNDLALPSRRVKTIFGYIQNHFFKANKKNYPRPHDCDNWYQKFVINILNSKNDDFNGVFSTNLQLDQAFYTDLSSHQKKKMANLAAFIYAHQHILNSKQ